MFEILNARLVQVDGDKAQVLPSWLGFSLPLGSLPFSSWPHPPCLAWA